MTDKADIGKLLSSQNIFILTKGVVNILLLPFSNFFFFFFKTKHPILQAFVYVVSFTGCSYFWCTSNVADLVPLSSLLIIRSFGRGKSCSFKYSTIILNRDVYA